MYFQLTGTHVRLLGSMHLFPASNPRLPAWVPNAFEWAETLVFESDALAILPYLKRDAGTSLEHELPADVWRRLDPSWPTAGPLAPLSELHAWAALVVAPTLCQRVVEGVEPRMLRVAAAQAKPHRYLETAAEIAASLETIPLQTVCTGLELLLADLTEPQRTLERMQDAWLQGDAEALYSIATESPMFRLPGVRSALLESRNRAWASHVRGLLDSPQRTLVVVGALHLAGPGSLIEAVGHAVEPIPLNG
ncbi:TraB/GumN family protein [Paraburkholderia sp. DHOC27]|uniref:TraB/GumN family protein n=1 Tax=Paraburkholderia sp. DHOC27 TaxID=2303330 RepID=UPI000E3DDC2B|nr:TraB/GumN family protein [Paraburkholderia sp. DHOC27]RFU46669.1 TraB/GumN family protein [Paraburkholderia sp. DHOC27]